MPPVGKVGSDLGGMTHTMRVLFLSRAEGSQAFGAKTRQVGAVRVCFGG